MIVSRRHLLLPLVLLAVLHDGPLSAQQPGVGQIERIAEVVPGRREREISQPSPRVQVRPSRTAAWADAAPRARIGTAGMLQVQRNVDVRLGVDRPTHRGVLTALPELLNRQGARVFPPVAGQGHPNGIYGVTLTQPQADELLMQIERGALLVDWTRGRLVVDAAGTRTVIRGTEVAFSVDTIGDSGILFLRSGEVEFPDHPEVRVPERGFVQLRRGMPPVVLPPGAISVREVDDAFDYHNRVLWNQLRPFWKDRRLLGAVAIGLTGALIYTFTRSGDDGLRTGTVTIPIPPGTP
jgi:hypothetical protein